MKQNLVSNGGFLDEVHWAVNTDKEDDLKYLDRLVETSEEYKKIVLPGLGFDSIWKHAVTKGNLYIKIDDDIVSLDLTPLSKSGPICDRYKFTRTRFQA